MAEPNPIRVVSNVALVLKEYLDHLDREFPDQNIQYVYDENLSYESAIRNFRNNQNISNNTDQFLPAFAFRRSVFRYRESGVGRRSIVCEALDRKIDEDRAFKYIFVSASIDVEFLYINDVMEEIEHFELIHMAEAMLNKKKNLEVAIPEVDTFQYQMEFQPLEGKTINIDDNYYKGVSGRTTISGNFLLFTGTSGIIKEIQVAVQNFNESVLGSLTITPTP